jgi:hypothetical protein
VYFYFNGLKLQNRSLSENIFFLKSRLDWTQTIYEYCEIIINRWSLILGHFVVHLNHKKLKSKEIQLSHWLLPVVFETTNSRTHGIMHFVETTEIGANDKNTFTVVKTGCIIIFVVNILWSMSLQIYYKSAKLKLWYAKMASPATKVHHWLLKMP